MAPEAGDSNSSKADSGAPESSASPSAVPQLSAPPTPAQRERAIELLTRDFADDKLSMDEFEQRVELVYRATTASELQSMIPQLMSPGTSVAVDQDTRALDAPPAFEKIVSVFANTERSGLMRVPRQLRIVSFVSNAELDLRRATFSPGVTEIQVRAILGNVEIKLPDNARVEMSCSTFLASAESRLTPVPGTGSEPPIVIRITGRAILSSLEVSDDSFDD